MSGHYGILKAGRVDAFLPPVIKVRLHLNAADAAIIDLFQYLDVMLSPS
jgi:hypothetical protein